MNINGIYANQTNRISVDKEAKGIKSYEKGQIIEGIISKVSDKVSINFSGQELKFSKETVQNAVEGDARQFEIMDISKNGIVLKEVGRNAVNNVSQSSKFSFTTVGIDQVSLLESKEIKEEECEEEDLSQLSNRMTEEDYEALQQEGFTLEDFNLERLNNALARIKEQKGLKQEAVKGQVEQLEKTRELAKAAARAIVPDAMVSDLIATRLVELDLPVTADNVARMISAMELGKEAVKITDASSAYLIANQLEPSAQNIYKAVHSRAKEVVNDSEELWQELKGSVHHIIEEAGLLVDDESLGNARWLISRELPVTGENLKYKQLLDQIKESDSVNFALNAAAMAIQDGNASSQVVYKEDSSATVTQIIQDFSTITMPVLTRAYQNKLAQISGNQKDEINLSLKDLKLARKELSEEQIEEVESGSELQGEPIQLITAKRQLEEIRLRLTAEAGNKMLAKGIRIETEGLSRIVEELKNIEDSYYQKLLQEVGGSGEEQVSLLKETSNRLEGLQQAPSVILGKTFASRSIETVENLSNIGASFKERFLSAGESYEALMTKPRADMGDSIQKAFEHVDHMLEEMNLEVTKANARAVRILSYNNIEITEDTINSMKAYDAKVNALFENLSPPVTATLIKEGINPLQMPIEELNQKAIEIMGREGITSEQSFSEYLVRLEDNKEIGKDERTSYIGIYRLLNQVEKTDGAAIGSLVKANQEITLNNLLTAVRTKKYGSMDASIDDNFGSFVSMNKLGESITDQINTAFSNVDFSSQEIKEQSDYQTHLLSSVAKDLTPNKLLDAMQAFGDAFGNTSLEKMKEQFDASADETLGDAAIKLRMEQIRELSNDISQEQKFLKDYEIPNSIHNIQAAKEMSKNAASLYQNIRNLDKELSLGITENSLYPSDFSTALSSEEALKGQYEDLKASTEKLLEQALSKEDLSANDLQRMSRIRNTLNLTVALSKKEYYNIPVETKGGVMAMNLTVIHEGDTKGRVSIRIPSEHFGTISAELLVNENQIKCFVTAESKAAVTALKQEEAALNQEFEKIGLDVDELYYDTKLSNGSNFIFKNGSIYKISKELESKNQLEFKEELETSVAKTSTDTLYLAAKTVVMHMKQIESNIAFE